MLLIISLILIAATVLPSIRIKHWTFRLFEFIRPQVLVGLITATVLWMVFPPTEWWDFLCLALIAPAILWQAYLIAPFMPYKRLFQKLEGNGDFSILAANVFMDNPHKEKLQEHVRNSQPDVLVMMESNRDWQACIDELNIYNYAVKVPMDNTYGMHLYSRFPIESHEIQYLVELDVPMIEAVINLPESKRIKLFCFHPQPPSPTEAETSHSRDLAFDKLARLVMDCEIPCMVVGDFNSVAWSRITRKFVRITKLLDPRKGIGFLSTFHADYFFFRFPIDQLLHSKSVKTTRLSVGPHIGSDHFPLFGEFSVVRPEDYSST